MNPERSNHLTAIREFGRTAKDILIEPITFTRSLHERLGNSAFVLLPIGMPLALGLGLGGDYGVIGGIVGTTVTWSVMGALFYYGRVTTPNT